MIDRSDFQTVVQKIRDRQIAGRWSVKEYSKKLDISYGTLYRWYSHNGVSPTPYSKVVKNPSLSIIRKLFNFYLHRKDIEVINILISFVFDVDNGKVKLTGQSDVQ